MSWRTKINGWREMRYFDNHWHLVFSRLIFPRESLNIYRYKNLEILTDRLAGDLNGAREVLTSPMYRKFLPHMQLDKPLNVLDLGANNGGFPLLLKSEGLQLKKVVCVELNPKTVSRLRFNLERNLENDFTVLNAAVCGKNCVLQVSLGTGSVSDNIYEGEYIENSKTYMIKGLTFDEIFDEHLANETVDICKVDVEAAEYEIFNVEMPRNLSKCRYLIMEIHPRNGKNRQQLIENIRNQGFETTISDAPKDDVWFFRNLNQSFDQNSISR